MKKNVLRIFCIECAGTLKKHVKQKLYNV